MREAIRGIRLMLTISWRADRVRTIGAAIAASGQMVVLPVRAVGLKVIVDGVLSHHDHTVVTGLGVMVGATAVNRFMAWASLNIRMRLREHTQLYLDTHLMGLTAAIPGIEHHELPEYLDAVERLRAERPYLANPFNPISWSFASIAQVLAVAVFFAGVAPFLALLPLLGLPAAVTFARAENRSIALVDGQAEKHRVLRHLMDLATEPSPAKEVRIYGLGDELLRRRVALFDEVEAERSEVSVGSVVRVAAWWVLFAAGYGAALTWMVNAVHDGRVSVGAVVLVLTLGAQLNAQLTELAFHIAWFARSLRAVRRLVWFSDYAAGAHRAFEVTEPHAPPAALRDGVRLDGVAFAYPGSQRQVLRDVNLFLPAGSTVAIVGENGSGKTTLVKLLARMYEPTDGQITVDGIDIRSFEVEAWRERLSAGFQDFATFELLARQSIGAGNVRGNPSDRELLDAIDRGVATDVLTRLPDGLDSQLGRQFAGVELSTGQWQKVALARAMLRQAPLLLVLDEPTASLDAPTEHALFERFAGAAKQVAASTGGITVLISHRFSTVRMADLIVVVINGAIAETGTHDELMRADRTYAELYRLQARAYRIH